MAYADAHQHSQLTSTTAACNTNGRTMRPGLPYDFLVVVAAEPSLTVQPITGLVAVDMNSRKTTARLKSFHTRCTILAQRTKHNYSFIIICISTYIHP